MSCKPKPLHFELYNDVHQTIARTRKKKKLMPLQFSVGIGSSEEENLILLTDLKKALKEMKE